MRCTKEFASRTSHFLDFMHFFLLHGHVLRVGSLASEPFSFWIDCHKSRALTWPSGKDSAGIRLTGRVQIWIRGTLDRLVALGQDNKNL